MSRKIKEYGSTRAGRIESCRKKGDNKIKALFVLHTENTRSIIKMRRIGVATKTMVTLFFCYSDLITGALVFLYFLKEERIGQVYPSGSCLALSLLIQAITASYQYKKKGGVSQFFTKFNIFTTSPPPLPLPPHYTPSSLSFASFSSIALW